MSILCFGTGPFVRRIMLSVCSRVLTSKSPQVCARRRTALLPVPLQSSAIVKHSSTCWPKRWKCLQTQRFQTVACLARYPQRGGVQHEMKAPSSLFDVEFSFARHCISWLCPCTDRGAKLRRIYDHAQTWRRCGTIRDLPAFVAFASACSFE